MSDAAQDHVSGPHRSRWRSCRPPVGTTSKIGFHGGKVTVHRPRVRSFDGQEAALPTWTAAQAEDWLGRWAMNLMLINVSTRQLRRAVRLPEGDLPAIAGDGTSKSAASRRFVALSAERLAAWMSSELAKLDLLVSRSTACISATIWCWSPPWASTATAISQSARPGRRRYRKYRCNGESPVLPRQRGSTVLNFNCIRA
jgi:hypothetical protein